MRKIKQPNQKQQMERSTIS
uniref:Uncharacterized protein n=1 Tax=Lepeophtheirus salmonis TaxID=72036 RepID=A0A0K2VEQ5_LEPSM